MVPAGLSLHMMMMMIYYNSPMYGASTRVNFKLFISSSFFLLFFLFWMILASVRGSLRCVLRYCMYILYSIHTYFSVSRLQVLQPARLMYCMVVGSIFHSRCENPTTTNTQHANSRQQTATIKLPLLCSPECYFTTRYVRYVRVLLAIILIKVNK